MTIDAVLAPPDGFVRFGVGDATVVCAEHVADGVRTALAAGSLFRYAAHHPDARPLVGRGVVYATPLPDQSERVVVRHNRHGGMFARVTGDLFLVPSRAPHELGVSEQLRSHGVATPVMLGFVLYSVLPGVCRADVMTREVQHSFDLSTALMSSDATARAQAWYATARLVDTLRDAGARHRDLNVKNVLLHQSVDGGLEACVLDVDRVGFSGDRDAVLEQNLARLVRSARKWQAVHGAPVSDAELDEFVTLVRERRAAPSSTRA